LHWVQYSYFILGGTESVRSRIHVLCSRTHFRRNGRRRVQLSCFALPDSLSAVPRASGPVFIFYALGPVFGGTEGVGSSFHVLRSLTHFQRYRRCRVSFSCFALPNSFSAVSRAPSPVFMFCAPKLVFSGTEGVGSRFHILCSPARFGRYRGHRVLFLCVAFHDLFFKGTKGVGTHFHVLRSRTIFRW
jgi:hypothetical protein